MTGPGSRQERASAPAIAKAILEARRKIHIDGETMAMLYGDGPFEVFLTTGDWGQDRMVITTRDTARNWEGIGWRKVRSLGDRYTALVSTAPSGGWLMEVIRLLDPDGSPGNYSQDVRSWANCARFLTALPRLIWSREDNEGTGIVDEMGDAVRDGGIHWGNDVDEQFRALQASGPPTKVIFPGTGQKRSSLRQKRTMLIRCGYHDSFAREMLGALGAFWDKERRAWSIEKRPGELDEIEYVLAIWSSRKKSSLVGQAFFDEEEIRDRFGFLKNHQVDAVRFLRERWNSGMHGTLLADDTGLGKSASSLAAALPALEDFSVPRIVVVGTTSALFQWEEEWIKFFGGSPDDVFFFTGDFEARNKARKNPLSDAEIKEAMLSKRLILTNYEFVSYSNPKARDMKYLKALLPVAAGSVLCLDECTNFKNETTGNFRAALMLSMVSSFSIGLTADPVVNNIGEMWRIMRVLDPSIYSKKEFYKNHVEQKDVWFFNRNAPAVDERGKPVYDPVTGKQKMGRKVTRKVDKFHDVDLFNSVMRPHFMRRLKADNPHVITTRPEWFILDTEGTMEERVAGIIQSKYEQWYRTNLRPEDLEEQSRRKNQTSSFDISTYLQQASDDPYTLFLNVSSREDAPTGQEESETEMLERQCANEIRDAFLSELDADQLKAYVPVKVRKILDLMGERSDDKVVIFSTYKKTVRRIAEHISEAFPERSLFIVTGEMSKKKKRETVKESQSTPGSVLICTDTLSMAMNLQQADTLFQYTIMWEPLTLEQRCGRIERMGGGSGKRIYILSSDIIVEEAKRRSIEGKKWIKTRALQR